eukprot:8279509-Pyramimonas_sp.AAC.1
MVNCGSGRDEDRSDDMSKRKVSASSSGQPAPKSRANDGITNALGPSTLARLAMLQDGQTNAERK